MRFEGYYMDKTNLFSEFKPISKEEWKQKVVEDLKGKDMEELIWHTEGLKIEPFYTEEDLVGTPLGSINRGHVSGRSWTNLEKIIAGNATNANQRALEALSQGADGIIFQLLDNEIPEFDKLLKNIVLESCAIYFESKEQSIIALQNYIEQHALTAKNLNGGIFCPFISIQKELTLEENPQFRRLFIPSSEGDIIQQLVGSLQKTVAVLDALTDIGVAPSTILKQLIIKFEIGSSYFREIAKLRACRILITALAKAYEAKDFDPGHFHIHAETSNASQPDEDTYNNMLRNTTQSMSAILGGCNSLYVRPHTDLKEEERFAKRIARNIPLILKEEASFDKVADPAAGSYYIENLTNLLVENAWEQFLENAAKKL